MDSSVCLHCKRNVPSSSLDLHTAHCARFIQLCPKCQEPVAISDLEIHINEYHSSHLCEICNVKVEGEDQWRKHQAQNCSKQIFLPCEFCELECLSKNLSEHEIACGSRSEMCTICNNYILKRVLKAHMDLHIDASHSASSSQHAFPLANIGKQPNPILNPASFLNENNTVGPAQLENENNVLIPCEFCQVGYAIENLEEHQLLCGTLFETCSRCHEKITRNQRFLHLCSEIADNREDTEDDDYWSKYSAVAVGGDESNQDEEDSIPCEVCGTRFPFSCIELHELSCNFSTMAKLQEEFNGKQNDEKVLNTKAHQTSSSIICDLCNTYVPPEIFEIHQARCMHFENERRSSKPTVKRNEDRPEKKSVKVERNESSVQRAAREKALLAASNRETTNPKIPQSKMKVVVLPDGQQILKKANPASEQGNVDVGHKLGRGESAAHNPNRDTLNGNLGARPKNQTKPNWQ